jgi:mono/diheme cytochrome c family protein
MWRFSLVLAASAFAVAAAAQPLGLGRAPTQDELSTWNSDIDPDGAGLPPGRGSVTQGAAVFAESCAACHALSPSAPTLTGPTLTGPTLAGGQGTLATPHPIQTVGSYWPYATTLFDYVRRAMPFNAPHSLSDNQVYAVVAYVLHENGIVGPDTVLDATNLAAIRMPNRDGFRPIWPRHD